MNLNKHNRSVPLLCSVCGGKDFSSTEDNDLVICAACNFELTRDDLISRNQESINMHVAEVKRDVVKDVEAQLKKSLQDAFRGSKNIKIR